MMPSRFAPRSFVSRYLSILIVTAGIAVSGFAAAQDVKPDQKCNEILVRIKSTEGAARTQAIEDLWEFHQALARRLSQGEGDWRICAALLSSSTELESRANDEESPHDISLFDVLENGRRAAVRLRALLSSDADLRPKFREQISAWGMNNESSLLWKYGELLRDANRLEEALRMLDEAAALEVSFNVPWIHLVRASIERIRGNYEVNLAELEEAERCGHHVELEFVPYFRAYLAWEYTNHYSDVGVPELAMWWLEQGKRAAQEEQSETHRNRLLAYTDFHEAAFMDIVDLYPLAMEIAEEALTREDVPSFIAAKLKIRWARARAELDRCAKILEQMDRDEYGETAGSRETRTDPPPGLTEARSVLEEAVDDDGLGAHEQYRAALRLARIEMDEGNPEAAEKWLLQAEPMAVAGACAESAEYMALRCRWLLDTGAPQEDLNRALEALRSEYHMLVERLAGIPARKGGVGFLYYDSRRRVLAELIRLHLRAAGGESGAAPALEDLLLAQNLGSVTRALGAGPAGISLIRENLLEFGRGMLSYLPAPDRSYVFAVDLDDVIVAEIPSEQLLLEARKRLMNLLWETHSDPTRLQALDKAAQRLARYLMPPPIREKVASWNGVTLVGLDLLGWTPFECLPLYPGKPVGLEKAVDWLPSPALGIYLERRAPSPLPLRPEGSPNSPEVLLLIAPETGPASENLDPKPDPIRLAPDQVRELSRAVQGCTHSLLAGKEATEERIVTDKMEETRVLCLLAHGASRKRLPSSQITRNNLEALVERPATLVLSPSDGYDGLLGCDEVEKLSLPSTVVLSACGAAESPMRFGDDGINHLGGACFQADSNCVLITRAKLEIDSTAALTAVFLESLVQRGSSPAQALKEARCFVAAQPEWSHPFFHSMLQVVGLGQEPNFVARGLDGDSKGQKKTSPSVRGGLLVLCWISGLGLVAGLSLYLWQRLRRPD